MSQWSKEDGKRFINTKLFGDWWTKSAGEGGCGGDCESATAKKATVSVCFEFQVMEFDGSVGHNGEEFQVMKFYWKPKVQIKIQYFN